MPLRDESWERVSLPMKREPINGLNCLWLFFQCLTKYSNSSVRNHSKLENRVLSVFKAYKAWGKQSKANYTQS